jgi:hypothetical protein
MKEGRPIPATASAPVGQAFPIVRRALKILADREVSPQTGLLKSTLLQLDSTFSERTYGASSFLDFVEKLAKEGLVHLKQAGRSVMVELNPDHHAPDAVQADAPLLGPAGPPVRPSEPTGAGWITAPGQEAGPGAPSPVAAAAEPATDGLKLAGHILQTSTTARWPMYLRNLKQVLRAADGGFDERRYGFGGLIELARGLQKEGYIRLERDRRGGLRVFPGAALQQPLREAALESAAPSAVEPPSEAGEPATSPAIPEAEELEPPPAAIVDATAELLGTTKRRRPARQAPATRRATKARTPSGTSHRPARSRKAAPVEAPEDLS